MTAQKKFSPAMRRSLLAQMSGTKSRKKNSAAIPAIPGSKGGLTGSPLPHPRGSNPKKGRKRNPDIADTKIAGTSVGTLATEALALLAGLLVGGMATNLVGNQLVGRVPPRYQAGGWLAGAVLSIVAGHYIERKFKLPIPLGVAGYAVASPMLLTAAQQANVPGFALAPVAAPAAAAPTAAGTLSPGRAPGMAGTLTGGNAPGTSAGTFKSGGIASMMHRSIISRLR